MRFNGINGRILHPDATTFVYQKLRSESGIAGADDGSLTFNDTVHAPQRCCHRHLVGLPHRYGYTHGRIEGRVDCEEFVQLSRARTPHAE